MKIFIGYIRVSTIEQGSDGHGLDTQRAKLQEYAALYNLNLIKVVEDVGFSGKSLDRPGLRIALDALDYGEANGILVVNLNRLSRSVAAMSYLMNTYFLSRFILLSVNDQIDTSTPEGRLVINLITSISQWEREAISERTSATLQHMISQGKHVGSPPLGFKMTDGKLCEVDSETEIVKRIVSARAAGCTLQEIVDSLVSDNIPTKRRGEWHRQTVLRVIKRASRSKK
jgi:site-specific DNA recombinase